MATRTILAPIDVQHDNDRLLAWVSTIARQWQANVMLLYVTPPRQEEGMYLASLHDTAERLRKLLEDSDSRVDYVLDHRLDATRAILERARELSVDLILQLARDMGPVQRWLQGSTTDEVISHSPCPVLAIPSHLLPPVNPGFGRILVATDLEDFAPLASARSWSELPGVHVTLFHNISLDTGVMEQLARANLSAPSQETLESEAADAVRKVLVHHPELRPAGEYNIWGGAGSSSAEIVRAILDGEFDLLITGHRHKNFLARLLEPSVAKEVLHQGTIPVWISPVR